MNTSVWRGNAIVSLASAALALAACGGSDVPSQDQLDQARQEGAQQAIQKQQDLQQKRQIQSLKNRIKHVAKGPKSSEANQGSPSSAAAAAPAASSATTSCGGSLSVGPDTSCAFAQNVYDTYYNSGQSTSIDVYSPVTGQTYGMTCTGSAPTVCRGGNNASVYFP